MKRLIIKIIILFAILLIESCVCKKSHVFKHTVNNRIESIETSFPFIKDLKIRDSLDLFLNKTECYRNDANIIIVFECKYKEDYYVTAIRSASIPESSTVFKRVGAIRRDNMIFIVFFNESAMIDSSQLDCPLALDIIVESQMDSRRESMEAFSIGKVYKQITPDRWLLDSEWRVTPGYVD